MVELMMRLVLENRVFELVQHAFAPQGGGRIEDAARHRRPSRFFGVGCTEEGAVDRRRFGFWRVFGKPTRNLFSGISNNADFPQNGSYQ